MIHALTGSALLAPFQVRSFRFQFPADLLISWGIEMENLVLGWYILVETGSVAEARAKGKARMEGKEYVMQDGDVVEVRFNV